MPTISWTKNYIDTKAVEAMNTFYGSKLSDPCVMGINKVELNKQYFALTAGDGASDFKNVIFYVFDVDMLISEYKLKDIEASGVMVLWANDIMFNADGNVIYTKTGVDSFYKTAYDAIDGLKSKYDGKYIISEID